MCSYGIHKASSFSLHIITISIIIIVNIITIFCIKQHSKNALKWKVFILNTLSLKSSLHNGLFLTIQLLLLIKKFYFILMQTQLLDDLHYSLEKKVNIICYGQICNTWKQRPVKYGLGHLKSIYLFPSVCLAGQLE